MTIKKTMVLVISAEHGGLMISRKTVFYTPKGAFVGFHRKRNFGKVPKNALLAMSKKAYFGRFQKRAFVWFPGNYVCVENVVSEKKKHFGWFSEKRNWGDFRKTHFGWFPGKRVFEGNVVFPCPRGGSRRRKSVFWWFSEIPKMDTNGPTSGLQTALQSPIPRI